MSFFENTRKPVGLGRENYGRHDECRAQRRGAVGASISECRAGRRGAGLRLRRRCEHEKAAEKNARRVSSRASTIRPSAWRNPKKINEAAIAEGRCAVLQGSVADMMFADYWFGAVTAFETVYFWPDLPRCFREVYRVLKVSGTFLIATKVTAIRTRTKKWTKIIGGMTIYKDVELKAYLEQAGFHEVQIHKKKGWLCITARK